jgi:hypothetical protein
MKLKGVVSAMHYSDCSDTKLLSGRLVESMLCILIVLEIFWRLTSSLFMSLVGVIPPVTKTGNQKCLILVSKEEKYDPIVW